MKEGSYSVWFDHDVMSGRFRVAITRERVVEPVDPPTTPFGIIECLTEDGWVLRREGQVSALLIDADPRLVEVAGKPSLKFMDQLQGAWLRDKVIELQEQVIELQRQLANREQGGSQS